MYAYNQMQSPPTVTCVRPDCMYCMLLTSSVSSKLTYEQFTPTTKFNIPGFFGSCIPFVGYWCLVVSSPWARRENCGSSLFIICIIGARPFNCSSNAQSSASFCLASWRLRLKVWSRLRKASVSDQTAYSCFYENIISLIPNKPTNFATINAYITYTHHSVLFLFI